MKSSSAIQIPAADNEVVDIKDIQSFHFMIDIMPFIQKLYPRRIHELNVLDVGARTAAGTGLIAKLHHPRGLAKIRMIVDALDVDPRFRESALNLYPETNQYIIKDIYDKDMPAYDLVICSHTIEHVPNPERFVDRVAHLARDYAIFACPYNEDLNQRYSNAPGNHINSFTEKRVDAFEPIMKHTYDGQVFTGDLIVFVVKGKAAPLDDDFRGLTKAGRLPEAIKIIENVLSERKKFPTIWVHYANLLRRTGRTAEAVDACVE